MIVNMSEAPAGVVTDFAVGIQTEPSVSQIKNELLDPRIISKDKDQEGRDILATTIGQARKEKEEIKTGIVKTESELQARQENILVKLKQKLNISDKKTIELQEQLLEANARKDQLPDPKKMIEAYYEKVAETPLTNQEKRDLLKPEVLSQLSTDEYVALWKRLNPYFFAHTTRQGFRDHSSNQTSMLKEEKTQSGLENGFIDSMKDEKQLKSLFALWGLRGRDKTSVTMFLSKLGVLQAENEMEAKKILEATFSVLPGQSERYVDKTAVHFTAQCAATEYYGAENGNEVFFCYPSDVLASQYRFGLQADIKSLTEIPDETIWNDVYIWPNTFEDPCVPIDAGMVFLPKNTLVDSSTGSKYASEAQKIEGDEKKVMIEDEELINKYSEWVKNILTNADMTNLVADIYSGKGVYDYKGRNENREKLSEYCKNELLKLGFRNDNTTFENSHNLQHVLIDMARDKSVGNPIDLDAIKDNLVDSLKQTTSIYKLAENTVKAEEYWEDFFSKNPNLRPKHIVYYDGNPTNAIYRFQQENGIGAADTSKTEGQFLGFEDHFIPNHFSNQKTLEGRKELIELANKIVTDHYAFK
jgi:hypothetical protein